MSPDRSIQVLVVGAEHGFEDEFRTAFAGIPDRTGVVFFARSLREGLEIARDRQTQFVVVAMDEDIRGLTMFSKELHQLVPGVVIAAAFHPDQLGEGKSESDVIIELLRARVRDFLRRPLSTTELRQVLDRLLSESTAAAPSTSGRIVSFVSNKGGVGKSTLSVNVACELAKRNPGQVLLVDTSLQLGICALMLDLKPTTTIVDAMRERDRLDETLLRRLSLPHSSGLRLLAAPADALEATEVGDEAIASILHLASRTFDYVVVDTFPMLDSVVMSILDLSDLIFVVVQGTAPTVAGVARLLPVLEGLGFPASRQRVVLNRSYRRFFGDLTPSDIEGRLHRPVDYVVPYDKQVLVSMNTGSPYILRAGRWRGFGRAVSRIADGLSSPNGVRANLREEPTAAVEQDRARFGVDRRSGRDRRARDIGRPQGERRSGVDRRALQSDAAARHEMTL